MRPREYAAAEHKRGTMSRTVESLLAGCEQILVVAPCAHAALRALLQMIAAACPDARVTVVFGTDQPFWQGRAADLP
ncbi:MAG: hypothetical protein OEV33_06405, partial [Armatimonadota bacterium]|nr:hypothetical protein [Armatimonadota bacterium]